MKGSTDGFFPDGAKGGQQGWLMSGVDSNRVFQIYTGTLGVQTYLVGYTMSGVTFLTNAINKSLASTGTWQDVDISTDTGSDTALGAIFTVHNSASSSQTYGLRKNGSTDNRVEILRGDAPTLGLIGVDGSEIAEMQIGNLLVDLYLVGYVTGGAVFFTNAIDKSTGTTGSYQDVDITADIGSDNANGAIVEVYPSLGTRRQVALRPNGTTYDFYLDVDHSYPAVGIDANDIFEQKIELTEMDLYLGGYTIENCDAGNWWNCDWGVRRKITFQNSARTGALTNFPVLICLTSSTVDYSKTQNLGEDLRFVDSNDTDLLNHEIEYWNESGTSYVWVKIPQLDATDTDFIYMYYDNSGASAPSQASQDATWSNNFDAVYHLHNDFLDSTTNNRDGTNSGSTDVTSNRLAGDHQSFRGTGNNDHINTNWTPSYANNEDFTWEGWFRTDDTITRPDDIMGIEDRFNGEPGSDSSEIRLGIRENAGGSQNPVDAWNTILRPDSGGGFFGTAALGVTANTWYHVALVRDGSTGRTYLNGTQVDSGATTSNPITFPSRFNYWPTTTNRLLIGAQYETDNATEGSIRNRYEGELDEIRTSSNVARSPDWLSATYDTIMNCSTFNDITPEATAVDLMSFEAEARDSAVELTWETGSEIDNLGFHLYRSTEEEGPYEQITSSVIPGLGSSPEGAKYRYRDSGLTNGLTYYYKLEDIETTGVTEFHGPVSATPLTGASVETVEATGAEDSSEETPQSRITYGEPSANGVVIKRLGRKGLVLELLTEGFYAYPEDDGTVRLEVPGLELVAEAGEPAVPVYRGWVKARVGRKVKVGKVRAKGVQAFTSLRPRSAPSVDVISSLNGTTRAGGKKVRKAFLRKAGLYPEKPAQLVSVGFQEEIKKALIELAPLRWDESSGRLLLARRLTVWVNFKGREPSEIALGGGKGRHHVESHGSRPVWARFAVQEPGLYGVRFEDVFGKRGRKQKVSKLRLSRQGEPVAFLVRPRAKVFKRGSVLYFVSEGAKANPYGQEAVYELEKSGSSVVMGKVDGSPRGTSVAYYWKTLAREENVLYQAALLEARDVWQWDWFFGPMKKSYLFQVDNLSFTSESSHLDVWLAGASDFPENPDHHVRLYVNGSLVAEDWWDGEVGRHITAELGAGLLHEGENILEIEDVGDTEAAYSMVMLDRYEVRYPAALIAAEGVLEGSFTESGAAWVSGLESSWVLDVTGEQPKWLRGLSGVAGEVGFGVESGHRYLMVSRDRVLSAELRTPRSTSLRSEGNAAEYLVIGPREFLAAAEPLLEYRWNEGLRTKAVAIEDIYSEFGYGEETPESIREFLSYVYHHWSEPSLRYVLLVGDSTYDTKDYLKTGVESHVPVKLVKTRYVWTASDPWYGAINGEDILPDVAIGRLPAASVDEVQVLVAKILAYENREGDPEAPVVLITDNPDRAGDFDADGEEIASTVLSGEAVEKIYLTQLGTAGARSAIINAFDQGASLMSYMGHGAIHLWANENLFNIWQVDSLAPQPQQPLLFTMNCLNGYFHFPYFNSLSEELLKAEGKGIIAAFSPTGFSLNEPAHRFHKALLDQVVNQDHERLGDAILAGQAAYANTGAFPELLSIYHLLGDPALKLR